MKTIQLIFLSILSGLLLAISWPPNGYCLLIFISFVPLLIAEQTIYISNKKYGAYTLFLCSYLSFLIWNILSTWWIKNASFEGAAMAILCNALLMSGVFQLYHNTKKRIGEKWSGLVFICLWISFEFLHMRWDLTYPWLTLGNVFAANNNWIQWYEYTGAFGGSLWVLVVNLMLFYCVRYKMRDARDKRQDARYKRQEARGKTQDTRYKTQSINNEEKGTITGNFELLTKTIFQLSNFPTFQLSILLLLILVPILISYQLLNSDYSSTKKLNVTVVQPNIDPYNEKFSGNTIEQVQKMLNLAKQKIDSTTDYVIFPETALAEGMWENDFYKSPSISYLQEFLKHYPNLQLVIGASTYKAYNTMEAPSSTARKFSDDDGYYESYNTALQLNNSGRIQVYHKSKLVPGVEKMPFPFIFKYFENYAIDLGGTSGSLGSQDERTVFYSANKTGTAPVICYESIYGEFVGNYISNGADFISIITNDGWWGDTPGYKQHLLYGALRAIETRKWIARSANTGISCFINPKGEILQATNWWIPAIISQDIELNDVQTFYVKHGDYIARGALFISLLFLIYSLLIRFNIIKK